MLVSFKDFKSVKGVVSKSLILAILFLAAGFRLSAVNNEIKITGLKCEYAENPLGLDIQSPRFSWSLESPQRMVLQESYQILIATSREELEMNNGGIWNSGRINSSNSTGISYKGPELLSRQR